MTARSQSRPRRRPGCCSTSNRRLETAEAAALERLLLHDVTLEATPLRTCRRPKTCVPYLRNRVLGSPGTGACWHSANGQPAAVAYTRGPGGEDQPYGLVVISVTGEGIRKVWSFGDPSLVTVFGFRPAGAGRERRADRQVTGRSACPDSPPSG